MANEFKAKNGVITPVLQSTVATGTAPLTVTSTTRVANLNVATAGTADTATTATTATSVVNSVAGTGSIELVRGNMGDNDNARILVGATASNAGYLEIATADDGTEPIHVRQYSGTFGSLIRTATLLDASGNTSFPLTVTATTFSGALSGNASTATSAATLTTARTIALTGDVTYTSGAFNGSGNVTGVATLATVNSNVGTFNSVTVNAKGLVTSASNVGYLTAEADTLATVTARGATATASITIGTGGTYVAGSIYSDSSWGMIFRAKQASPSQAEYRWATSADTELMRLTTGGNLTIPGAFAAASKSFLIPHPTKEGKKLRYGSLEGPENGVYIRGKLKDNNTIELPEYWTKLVDPDSITVSLTSIGKHQDLYVENIADNKVIVGNGNLINKNINCFFVVYGERVDIDKLVVESE